MTDTKILSAKEIAEIASNRRTIIEKEKKENLEKEINSEIYFIFKKIQETADKGNFAVCFVSIYDKSKNILEECGYRVHTLSEPNFNCFKICWDNECVHDSDFEKDK